METREQLIPFKRDLAILTHCRRLSGPQDLETMDDYPAPVKKLLGQAKRVKVDFIIKRFI